MRARIDSRAHDVVTVAQSDIWYYLPWQWWSTRPEWAWWLLLLSVRPSSWLLIRLAERSFQSFSLAQRTGCLSAWIPCVFLHGPRHCETPQVTVTGNCHHRDLWWYLILGDVLLRALASMRIDWAAQVSMSGQANCFFPLLLAKL